MRLHPVFRNTASPVFAEKSVSNPVIFQDRLGTNIRKISQQLARERQSLVRTVERHEDFLF
jgi:hypothetical protein